MDKCLYTFKICNMEKKDIEIYSKRTLLKAVCFTYIDILGHFYLQQ